MTEQNFLNRFTFHYQNDFLGGGSFGKVFKAYDNTLNRYVAVKIADQITHGTKTFSLLDEFNALEALEDHPNIAKYEKLYTFETHRGKVDYALMQYYPDGNLSNLIKKNQLSPQQRESMALQLLEGIRFLHQHQVVHRDLKPSNILIHQHDLSKEYIPKITDFGLSKKANTDKNTHFTNSFAAGTYAYSSPEQLKGETLRFNTDLWAYGAIVYEIFTGKTLFHIERKNTGSSAMDVREILDNIINSDTTSKVRELPAKWQPVVNACLERNAQTRVKTAAELLDILHGKTVMQPPTPSKPQPGTDETQFTPTPSPIPQPSSGDATQFSPTQQPTPAPEVPLPPATQPNRTGWYIGIAAAVAMLIGILLVSKGKEPIANINNNQKVLTYNDSIARGKELFTEKTCTACHLDDGRGLIGPNLTDKNWILGGDFKSVYNTISKGGRPGKGMMAWESSISKDDRQLLASYVLSLQKNFVAGKEPGKEPEGDLWENEIKIGYDY